MNYPDLDVNKFIKGSFFSLCPSAFEGSLSNETRRTTSISSEEDFIDSLLPIIDNELKLKRTMIEYYKTDGFNKETELKYNLVDFIENRTKTIARCFAINNIE